MRVYLDESVSVVLATVLRQHGIDCLTARDAGRLGVSDDAQLTFATTTQRVLFTHDTKDFLQLAAAWSLAGRAHAGLVLAHQVPFRELILRFRAFLLRSQAADLTNQLLWLPPPFEER